MSGIGQVETEFYTFGEQDGFPLQGGSVLKPVTLAYEMYGELNEARDNAVLLFHALSGSQHAAGRNTSVPGCESFWDESQHEGWWDAFIGPGKVVNTDKFCVICVNYLGGCYGSTGPGSVNPETGQPYGGAFPNLTISDIVDSQVQLLDHLCVDTLHAVIGASLGGMMCMSFATRYPERVNVVIPISTSLYATTLQRLSNFEQIFAIEQDPLFRKGDYYDYDPPVRGLALARMIAHKSYVSLQTIERRADRAVQHPPELYEQYHITHPIESYMLHQGLKFTTRFDANTYLRFAVAWLRFDLLKEAGGVKDFQTLFAPCRHQRYMVYSVDSDVCFYPDEQLQMVSEFRKAGMQVRHITVHSEKGHDSFLLEPELFGPHLVHSLEHDW